MVINCDGGEQLLATEVSEKLYAAGWLVAPVTPISISQAFEFPWPPPRGLEIIYLVEKRLEALLELIKYAQQLSHHLMIAVSYGESIPEVIRAVRIGAIDFLDLNQSLDLAAIAAFSRLLSRKGGYRDVKRRLQVMTPVERRTMLMLLGESTFPEIQATLAIPSDEANRHIREVFCTFEVTSQYELIESLT